MECKEDVQLYPGRHPARLIENIVECKDVWSETIARATAGLIENIVECKYIICINSVFMPVHACNTILTHK